MFKKEPSEGMKAMYQAKREATAAKVQNAIDLIKSEGRIVTRKELLELTGLSSGSLSQDYIREILKENGVCQYRSKLSQKGKETFEKRLKSLEAENSRLENENENLRTKVERLEKKYRLEQQTSDKLADRLSLLNGKYQSILEYLEMTGQDITSFL